MYDKMFQYVKESLEISGGEISRAGHFPFRKRSEHIKRVFTWAGRLAEGETGIDKEALLTAAVFHDIGYSSFLDDSKHAENGAVLCREYLTEKGYDRAFIDQVAYLVANHSRKELMAGNDIPLELILLMEADLMDESGALSIVWDCMMEGSGPVQTFEKTYEHIVNYTYRHMKGNPMVTTKAKDFWYKKQLLAKEFIEQLSFDLGLDSANGKAQPSVPTP